VGRLKPDVGKSRLAEAVAERIAAEPHIQTVMAKKGLSPPPSTNAEVPGCRDPRWKRAVPEPDLSGARPVHSFANHSNQHAATGRHSASLWDRNPYGIRSIPLLIESLTIEHGVRSPF
jgi:hypothetical protein